MHGYILTYFSAIKKRYNSWDYVKHAWLYSDLLQCYKKKVQFLGLCEACMAIF